MANGVKIDREHLKPVPVGKSDWEGFSQTNYTVDKTLLVKELIDDDNTGVALFTRPRWFGKTTALRKGDKIMISRRDFMLGGIGAASVFAGGCRMFEGAAGTDPNLSVFLSDVHTAAGGIPTKWGVQPTYQNGFFERTVDEILAMRPRPARVVVFGDVALWFGYGRDYETALPIYRRLTEAGIELIVTTGNHDHRAPMFKHFPKQKALTPVPGRLVSIVDLGFADLLLLDTLREKGPAEGDDNFVGGDLDDAQFAWLEKEARARTRPFFCGGHHPPKDLNGRNVSGLLAKIPHYAGWFHGHNHRVLENWHVADYSQRRIRRVAGLPSTGWWGDIGYATLRTYPDCAVLTYEISDFFFPKPLEAGETRPPEWDRILHDHVGRTVTFDYIG